VKELLETMIASQFLSVLTFGKSMSLDRPGFLIFTVLIFENRVFFLVVGLSCAL
jgi:hypothetical protein